MPRHVDRPLPHADALREALAGSGVDDAPRSGDPFAVQGLLYLAAWLVDRRKVVRFGAFSWEDPGFVAEDEKVSIDVRYASWAGSTAKELREALRGEVPRVHPRGLLALDARASPLKEFELAHLLYGEVTLYSFPAKPPAPRDPRIEAAREAGWAATLKEHNLLPGRGIVVRDQEQGLLLTEPACRGLQGLLVLLRGGDVQLWWNPFAEGADAEMQYWLRWGRGERASEWKEVMRFEGDE